MGFELAASLPRTRGRQPCLADALIDRPCDLPAEGVPEAPALDVREPDADAVERDLVDFQHRIGNQ